MADRMPFFPQEVFCDIYYEPLFSFVGKATVELIIQQISFIFSFTDTEEHIRVLMLL